MTREEYEEIANAYTMAYQDYSSMMRKTNPDSWTVEAARRELEELRLLMKQYEDEHPEECRNPAGDHDTEQADRPIEDEPSQASGSKDDILSDEEFLKELEAMDGPDEPTTEPVPAVPKKALFDRLREAGVAKVSVEYDGACDSGCVEDVSAIGVGGEEITLVADVRELVEKYVCERLPGGWEINEGSFGEVEIDVLGGTVIFDHKQRYTEY